MQCVEFIALTYSTVQSFNFMDRMIAGPSEYWDQLAHLFLCLLVRTLGVTNMYCNPQWWVVSYSGTISLIIFTTLMLLGQQLIHINPSFFVSFRTDYKKEKFFQIIDLIGFLKSLGKTYSIWYLILSIRMFNNKIGYIIDRTIDNVHGDKASQLAWAWSGSQKTPLSGVRVTF